MEEDHRWTLQLKRAKLTEASPSTMSKRPRPDVLEELFESQSEERDSEMRLLLPYLDSSEKINVSLESRVSEANSDPYASSISIIENNYYVFLSFRGLDTRNGFVDHLYHRLRDVGLRFHPNFVFRDDKDLPFGEDIAANLISAITHSKVAIPVISQNYASSEWCLRELIHIMECKESRGQIILPVFYKVKPKHVRCLQGRFGKAFQSHEHQFDEEVKQQGREALKKAASSRVLESKKFANGREAELVNELVEIVTREQQRDFQPRLPMNLVGIDDHVARVMKLADTAYPNTRIIGIYGIGGIGKTTLATVIYNRLFDEFKCRCFLKDIRETINRKGIEHVQSRLISDILKKNDHQVPNSDIGIRTIQSSCTQNKVLILLDDVDSQDHLDNLIGGCSFMSGSRIIVTCRDKALLKSKYEYELEKMNFEDSLHLFGKYAFEGKSPPKELALLSIEIVKTTGGLPLALMVIGSLLKGKKGQRVWIEMLNKLTKAPDMTVQQKLRISYDALEPKEQQIFLDIACLFIGTDQRFAIYLWDDLEFYPLSALAKMTQRLLINYDDNNELRMHDQLRDLGRVITHPADKMPWECSRLWDKEAMKVLGRKETNEYIEALRLDKNGSSKFMEEESFKRMPNLKFLHLNGVDFAGDFRRSLSELRWLKWEGCPNSFEATNVYLEKLLLLDLSCGNIHDNWGGWSSIKMERLKVLNLSWCSELERTPNLSRFKSLEMLILENCENLEEIDPSIGDVKDLIALNLRYCASLKKLPAQLGEVKGLVSLDLWACENLQELPREMGTLEELKELKVGWTAIKEIPPCHNLKKLEILDAYGCKSLVGLPDSISHMKNLLTLDLRRCFKLYKLSDSVGSLAKLQCLSLGGKSYPYGIHDGRVDYCLYHIPNSIGKLEWLIELNLSDTGIRELPESIGDLKNLKILNIDGSEDLSNLPSTISKLAKLEELHASRCGSLGGEISIDELCSLKILELYKTRISGFSNTLDKLSRLEKLDLKGCKMLQLLPQGISKLPSLLCLQLTYCDKLQLLPELPACLIVLGVTCQHHTLPQLSHLILLKELIVEDCRLLESVPELPSKILKLHVRGCDKLKVLPKLSSLEFLSELILERCCELTEIKGLEALKSLVKLNLSGCRKLSNLDGLEHLKSLRYLDMGWFSKSDAPLVNDDLVQVRGLHKLKKLEELYIRGCQSLVRPDLLQLTHLKRLIASECHNLVELKGLEGLINLEELDLHGCKSIETLPDLSCLDKLKSLFIGHCWKLHNVKGLEKIAYVQRR